MSEMMWACESTVGAAAKERPKGAGHEVRLRREPLNQGHGVTAYSRRTTT
jgi:hypothetical protein